MSMRAVVVTATCLALAATGCSSNRSRPLPDFETIHVQSVVRPADGLQVHGDQDKAQTGAEVGAKGGAAAGAAWSLACGPWFLICLPFFTAFGAVVGGPAGALTGAVGDAAEMLPREQAKQFESALLDIHDRRDFFVEIRDGVRDGVPLRRRADRETAAALIIVGPEKIELVQSESTHLALRVRALLLVEWDRSKRTPRTAKRRYVHTTAEMPVEFWLQDNGAAIDAGFTECIDKVVEAMAWDLAGSESTTAYRLTVTKEGGGS